MERIRRTMAKLPPWLSRPAVVAGAVLAIVAMAIGGGMVGVKSIAGTTSDIIVHPFTVTNEALEARWQITAIHRSVRDAILATTDAQRRAALDDIAGREAQAIAHLRLARERFLGDRTIVDEAIAAIESWRPIRAAVLDHALRGEREEAARIMFTQGTQHFVTVDDSIDAILAFARNKATELHHIAARKALFIVMGTVGAATALGGMLAFGAMKGVATARKSRALMAMADAVMALSRGDLDGKAPEAGGGAGLDRLASAVEALRASLLSERRLRMELADSEEQLRETRRQSRDYLASRDLFSGILTISADAIVSLDENQNIVLFNQGAERIFGYAASEVLGRPLDMLLPPEVRAVHRHHIVQFGQGKDTARQMGTRGRIHGLRKSGEVFPAEASISRVEVNGRPTFTATLRDVTEQWRTQVAIETLNADLAQRAVQLENANRELESFSYSVSHDLRAPLRGIDGFSQVLIEDYADALPAEARDFLDRMRKATQRMGRLIDDILGLSRLTRGEIRKQPLDLSAMARTIADDLARTQPDRTVTFVIADGLEANGDPLLVEVMLSNLLGNAWKYTSKHPVARIEFGACRTADGRPAFFVKDDGAGFDMAYAHKLFGAFQRLHGMDEYPGTGIGLATAQRIVHKHGGKIWAEGAVEKGATITFTLQ